MRKLMAKTVPVASTDNSMPFYIEFLMSPNSPLDFHITVGDPTSMSPERIGVDKWMLIARSKVFRVMLLESIIAHNQEFNIPDLDAVTFKHFLVYMYGHDNTSSLIFEDAVKLLTAAEKYDVPDLKSKLGNVINEKVNADNLLVVLQEGLVCETVPHLWETVTNIIQFNTEEVFSNPRFPSASPQAMLYILQQESLSVPEIDVWRAALNWAKCQAQPMEGIVSPQTLRSTMLPLLEHIRLCTVSVELLNKEVMTTEVLTLEEEKKVCSSSKEGKTCDTLVSVCNEIESRGLAWREDLRTCDNCGDLNDIDLRKTMFCIWTKDRCVELCEMVCQANEGPRDLTYQCDCEIQILCETDNSDPVVINFSQTVVFNKAFVIPLTINRRNVVLMINHIYRIEFTFTEKHRTFMYRDKSVNHKSCVQDKNDFKLFYAPLFPLCQPSVYGNHFKTLHYKTQPTSTFSRWSSSDLDCPNQ